MSLIESEHLVYSSVPDSALMDTASTRRRKVKPIGSAPGTSNKRAKIVEIRGLWIAWIGGHQRVFMYTFSEHILSTSAVPPFPSKQEVFGFSPK